MRLSTLFILCTLLVTGCSGSGDSSSVDPQSATEPDVVGTDGESAPANDDATESAEVPEDSVLEEPTDETTELTEEIANESGEEPEPVVLPVAPDAITEEPTAESTETLLPVPANIELRADKTFRIAWERNSAADYYRVLENPDGVSGYSDVSGELDESTAHYDHRVALHKRVNARYIVEACNADGCVASVQQLIEGSLEAAIGYFKASNAGPWNYFGSAVSVSGDGKTLAVGADRESSSATGINGNQGSDSTFFAGAVYVFALTGSGWQQQAYIKASNNEAGDEFGSAISLSDDGNTLVVSAPEERSAASGINGDQNDNSVRAAGAVYVFVRSDDNWQQQAYLKPSNNRGEDFTGIGQVFGEDLSLSADGNTLAVGSFGEDSPGTGINGNQNQEDDTPQTYNTGAVYVFVRSEGVWQQQTYIKAATSDSDNFGRTVNLSADGNNLAVAVYDKVTTDAIGNIPRGADVTDLYGAVYVYVRSGSTWQQQAFLRAGEGTWNSFGNEVNLSADGNVLAVAKRGPVEIFERMAGTWAYITSLTASNDGADFGSSISLSADGNTLVVGATGEDSGSTGLQGYQGDGLPHIDSGAAYVFTRPNGIWQQQTYVKASNSQPGIHFGHSVSLSANGDTMAISANEEGSITTGINGDQHSDPAAAPAVGAVYLY